MQSVTLSALQVTPPNPQIAKGTIQRFTATGLFSDGSIQNLTPLVQWISSDLRVAAISNAEGLQGLATSNAEGTTQITASLLNISGESTLTVTAAQLAAITVTPTNPTIGAGTRLQSTATGLFGDGTSQDLTTAVTWASSNPSVATISPQGLVTAVAAGSTTISATFQGRTGTSTLTVTAATLAAITVTPTNPTIGVRTTLPFTAVGIFSDGTSQDLTTAVTWASAVPGVATISNAAGSPGLATAVAAGTTTISATFQGVTGTTTLTVIPGTLAAVTVTPSMATIADGTTLQFVATGILPDGTTQVLTSSVTWISANPSVATISNAVGSPGLATAVAAGTTTISAAFQGVTGTTTLTVTTATLRTLEVTPTNPTIGVRTTLPFTAVGIFSDGTSQDLTTAVTWASAVPGVATISNAAGSPGLATAVAAGTTTISATLQGVTGTTTLMVTTAPLAAITVTPSIATIADGTTLQFVATGILTDGTTQVLTTSVTWASAVPGVATISNAAGSPGLATAVAAGTTTISAAFQGVTGTTTLTVTTAILAALEVTPAMATIADGTTLQFVATGILTDGTTQVLTTSVTWASAVPGVATISNAAGSQGLATAVAAGTTTISATFQGVTGTTTLTVLPLELAAITVAPANPTISCDRLLQFSAIGVFTDGSRMDITTEVTWASLSESVATISNDSENQGCSLELLPEIEKGCATPSVFDSGPSRTTTITATLGAIIGQTILTVNLCSIIN